MPDYPAHQIISTPAQLAALFGEVAAASAQKEVDHLPAHYRALIEASPFAVLATSGPDGLDASPRGDQPGFVVVENATTLLLPERRGNNRADSLHNLLTDSRVALLFLIPGHGETLRVNGRATIVIDPSLLARFAVDGKAPKCVLSIRVESAYFQCARAILRSQLWTRPAATGLPTAGQMLGALSGGAIDGPAYDAALPARQRDTLY